jgi:DNA-binding IclR family transcriptional regulator
MAEIGILRIEGKGRYGIGRRLAELNATLMSSSEIRLAAFTVLTTLADQTGESVILVVPDGPDAVLCIDRITGSGPVYTDMPPVGWSLDSSRTAVGKVILAHSGRHDRLSSISASASVVLAGSSHPALGHEFTRIRARGFAVDSGEFLANVCCVAGPVKDHRGRALAALGVGVPAHRFERSVGMLTESVIAACEQVTSRMRTGVLIRDGSWPEDE